MKQYSCCIIILNSYFYQLRIYAMTMKTVELKYTFCFVLVSKPPNSLNIWRFRHNLQIILHWIHYIIGLVNSLKCPTKTIETHSTHVSGLVTCRPRYYYYYYYIPLYILTNRILSTLLGPRTVIIHITKTITQTYLYSHKNIYRVF